jgi:hypothetical protein
MRLTHRSRLQCSHPPRRSPPSPLLESSRQCPASTWQRMRIGNSYLFIGPGGATARGKHPAERISDCKWLSSMDISCQTARASLDGSTESSIRSPSSQTTGDEGPRDSEEEGGPVGAQRYPERRSGNGREGAGMTLPGAPALVLGRAHPPSRPCGQGRNKGGGQWPVGSKACMRSRMACLEELPTDG